MCLLVSIKIKKPTIFSCCGCINSFWCCYWYFIHNSHDGAIKFVFILIAIADPVTNLIKINACTVSASKFVIAFCFRCKEMLIIHFSYSFTYKLFPLRQSTSSSPSTHSITPLQRISIGNALWSLQQYVSASLHSKSKFNSRNMIKKIAFRKMSTKNIRPFLKSSSKKPFRNQHFWIKTRRKNYSLLNNFKLKVVL